MNAAVLLLFKLLARLPLPVLHALGIALGWLIYWTPGRHSERMRNNLLQSGLCAPGRDCRRLLRQTISESGKAIVELLPVWLRPYESVLKLVKGTTGWERVDAVLATGKGAILIGPHIGCFEILNLHYAAQHPVTVMYKPPRKAVLAKLMLDGRQRGYATLVPTDLSGVRAQLAALKRHEAIGTLPDQVASSGDGVWAPFFRPPGVYADAGRQPAAQDRRRGVLHRGRAAELGTRLSPVCLSRRRSLAGRQDRRRHPHQSGRGRRGAPLSGAVHVELQPLQTPGRRARSGRRPHRMTTPHAGNLLRPALLPAWLGVGLLWLLHWLPLPLQAAIGNTLGGLLAWLPNRRRHIGATNLALCFPDVSASLRRRWLRQTFQASVRAALEHGILWWASDARVRRLIRIDNPEAAHGDGVRPVIWLAPHFVGLDMGGIA